MKLLIAEDDEKLLKSLVHIFRAEKFLVDGVSDGEQAYGHASTGDYDALILDIMMPKMDGIDTLKKLRSEGILTPVLFLTAKTEVAERVEGLDAGADDYLPKPFATAELLARVRAMLRRRENFTPDTIEFCGLSLNRSAYELSYKNKTRILSSKEFQIAELLLQRPKFVITSDELISRIWGFESDVDTSVVWVHISNLRKKIAALDAPIKIKFIRNAGYVLEEIK